MRSFYTFIIAFCCLAAVVRAQGDEPLRLTFDEAVSRSLDQSFNIDRAKADVLIAKADRLKTIAQVGPQLSGTYSSVAFDNAIVVNDIVYRPQKVQSGSITANVNLTAIVASTTLLRMQTARIDLSERARELAATETAFGVAEIYRLAQQAKEATLVAKSRMEATAKNQRDAQALLELGKIAKPDRLQIDIRYNQALIDLARAENEVRNVQSALKKVIGIEGDEDLELDSFKALKKDMVPEIPPPQETLQQAFEARNDVEISRLKVTTLERARWLSFSPYLPMVNASMNWLQYFGDLAVSSSSLTQSFRLDLTWNMWDNGVALLDFRKAQQELRKARIDNREKAIDVKIDVEKSWRNLELAKETLGLSEVGLEQAQEAYRGNALKFSLGAASVLDLLYSETTLNQAKLDLLSATVGLDVAYMKMRKALGEKRPVPL